MPWSSWSASNAELTSTSTWFPGWSSYLYTTLTTIIGRICVVLAILTIGPWALWIIYDIVLYLWRTISYEIPFVGGRARGARRPGPPHSLVQTSEKVEHGFNRVVDGLVTVDYLGNNYGENKGEREENAGGYSEGKEEGKGDGQEGEEAEEPGQGVRRRGRREGAAASTGGDG